MKWLKKQICKTFGHDYYIRGLTGKFEWCCRCGHRIVWKHEQTLHWVIVRTSLRKEQAVAKAIQDMGLDAWCPLETRWRQRRKNRPAKLWQSPALSQILFAAVPVALHGDLQRIRYFGGIGRDSVLQPIKIPYSQIGTFQDELDRRNARATRLYEIAMQGRQTIKPVKFRLGAGSDAPGLSELAEIIKSAKFGVSQPVDSDLAA